MPNRMFPLTRLVPVLALCLSACSTPQPAPPPPPSVEEWPLRPVAVVRPSQPGLAWVLNRDGRLLDRGPGQAWVLEGDTWLRSTGAHSRSYDGRGRLLHQGPPLQLDGVLEGPEHGPFAGPLWQVRTREGYGVVNAQGALLVTPIPWAGWWGRTASPDYLVFWNEQRELFVPPAGQAPVEVDRHRWLRASGPFAQRPVWHLCPREGGECLLMDARGQVLFHTDADEVLPLGQQDWLLRQGRLWTAVDAQGRPLAAPQYEETTRVQTDRGWAGQRPGSRYPLWVLQRPVGVGGQPVRQGVPGFLQQDGAFVPVPGGQTALEICEDVWDVRFARGAWRLNGRGERLGAMTDDYWSVVTSQPDWRIARRSAPRQQAVLDCQGQPLMDDDQVIRLREVPPGLAGQLRGEYRLRLWFDADLNRTDLPSGWQVVQASGRGDLLQVEHESGARAVFSTRSGRLLAQGQELVQLTGVGAVLLSQGERLLMGHDGQVLARTSGEIRPWGPDRVLVEDGGDVILLHADGRAPQRFAGMALGPALETEWLVHLQGRGGPVREQWVDPEGQVLLASHPCGAGQSVRLVPRQGEPVALAGCADGH